MWVLRTQDKASQETLFAPCLATHPLSQASTNGVFLQRACIRLPMCGWCLPAVAGLIAMPPHVSLPSEYKNRCSEKGPAWKAQERVELREMGPFPQTGAGAEQVWLGRWARAGNREHKTMRPRPKVQEGEEEEAGWGGSKESKERACVATWPPGRTVYSLTANLESWKHSTTSS